MASTINITQAKWRPLATAILLPFIFGPLHYEVKLAFDSERYVYALGLWFGYCWIFSLIGGILAAILTTRGKINFAWLSTAAISLTSLIILSQAETINEQAKRIGRLDDNNSIYNWNHLNPHKIQVSLLKEGWSIANNSNEPIDAIIVDYRLESQEATPRVIAEKRLCIQSRVHPTATVIFNHNDLNYGDWLKELQTIRDQVHNMCATRITFISAIPSSLHIPLHMELGTPWDNSTTPLTEGQKSINIRYLNLLTSEHIDSFIYTRTYRQ